MRPLRSACAISTARPPAKKSGARSATQQVSPSAAVREREGAGPQGWQGEGQRSPSPASLALGTLSRSAGEGLCRRQVADQLARVDRQIGLSANADRQLAERPLVYQLDLVDRHRHGMAL